MLTEFCSEGLLFVNTMQVMYPLVKVFELDQAYLDTYFNCLFRKCEEAGEGSRVRLLQVVRFMTGLVDKGLFDVVPRAEVWLHYASKHQTVNGLREFATIIRNNLTLRQNTKP